MSEISKCPHCGGSDKEQTDVDVAGMEVIVSFVCEDCGEYFERAYAWCENRKERTWEATR
jgi:transcription elongation factor Elf1